MKKLVFIAAIAGAALVGCTKNEVKEAGGQQEITFATPVVATVSKANVYGEVGANYDTKEAFTVFSVWHENTLDKWETGKKYMEKVVVSHKPGVDDASLGSGAWKPADDYYWPKVGVLSFAAYSPASATGTITYSHNGLSITGFQIPSDTKKQYDLMFSERTYNKTTSREGSNSTYDGVDIKFKHALSSIKFTAKTQGDYSATTTIKIKKITMWGMNSKGSFAEGVTDGPTYTNNPQWSSHAEPVAEGNAYVAFNGVLTLNTTATSCNSNDVILLPQGFTSEDAKIRVDYTMQTSTGDAIDQYKEVSIKNLSSSWVLGYRYTYHITIGLDDIYFAPTVEPWQAGGSHLVI